MVPIFAKNAVSMVPIFAKTCPIILVINSLLNLIVSKGKMGTKNREKEAENGGKQYYKNCGFASVVHENHIKKLHQWREHTHYAVGEALTDGMVLEKIVLV